MMRITTTKTCWILLCAMMLFVADVVQAHPAWKVWGQLNHSRHRCRAVQIGPTEVMVVGGWAGIDGRSFGSHVLRSCEIIDVAKQTVLYTDSLKVPRAEYGLAVMPDGSIFVLGGATAAPNETTASVERFDPVTRTWSAWGELLHVRRQLEVIPINDTEILVVGGRDPVLAGYVICEIFNVVTRTSTETAPFPYQITDHRLARDHFGRILEIGGRANGPGSPRYEYVQHFDTATRTWSRVMDMPTYMAAPTTLKMSDGRLLVSGGSLREDPNMFTDRAYMIGDRAPVEFSGVLQHPKQWHCVAEWSKDSAICFGGQNIYSQGLGESEWFDLAARTVTPGPPLLIARKYSAYASLTQVPGYRRVVLVIGGVDDGEIPTRVIEVLQDETPISVPGTTDDREKEP